MLAVQEYLRSGKTPEDLKNELAIEHRRAEGLVLFDYNMIDSPATHPIVMECRSLILEEGTWDIISMAFHRFFNYGEHGHNEIDGDFFAMEKIDGSILHLFTYRGRRMISTRTMIGATGPTYTPGVTFADVFKMATSKYPSFPPATDDGYNYVFELVSPHTTVVHPYSEPDLYLLTARKGNGPEVSLEELDQLAARIGVRTPERFPFRGDLKEVARMAAALPSAYDEGYVCVKYDNSMPNGSHRRLKVKNPAYVALSHMKDSAVSCPRAIVELVFYGNEKEFLSYFPDFTDRFEQARCLLDAFLAKNELEMRQLCCKFDLAAIKDDRSVRGTYAASAKKMTNPSYAFHCLDRGEFVSYRQYILDQIETAGSRKDVVESTVRKNMMADLSKRIGFG